MSAGSAGGRVRQKRHSHGLTLVELMIASSLGLFLILSAIGLLLVSRQIYATVDERIAVQETGHYAIAILARSVRQAPWREWQPDQEDTEVLSAPSIVGLDAKSLRMRSENIQQAIAAVSQGSDVLAMRFGGASDGSILNCAGFAVSKADEAVQGWSIFFVGGGGRAEPELRCKYRGKKSWRTEGIARGVESFQVLYGIDTNNDGLPNRFLNASQIEELNGDLDHDDEEMVAGGYWHKVVALRIALLVRGSRNLHEVGLPPPYHFFGEPHSALYGSSDRGTLVREADIPSRLRSRLRQMFVVTLPLRNRGAAGEG